MEIARTVDELRLHSDAWRALKRMIAIVPTMGALHEGHLSLIREAHRQADEVIVSIFVNPTQFAPGEDLDAYPRDPEGDLEKLRAAGVDLVWMPSVQEMYPDGFATTIHVEGPAKAGLEDTFRPGHFDGVATVVAKLFLQSGANVAVFGEKDYQQLLVVRRMAWDLDIPVKVTGAPIIRESDGLAMSSRNAYLSEEERRKAPALWRALNAAAEAILSGTAPDQATREARADLETAGFEVDYLEARNAQTLAPIDDPSSEPVRILGAARLGRTRLIDNIPLRKED